MHGRRGRSSGRPHGAVQGRRRRRPRVLHQRRKRQGTASSPTGRRRPPSSTGSRCAGRPGSAARSATSPARRPTPISRRGREVSRVGAWASQQSRPLESRAALEAAVETYARRFGDGDIPRPAYWRGYRMTPVEIEFWSDGAFRLHDRILFRRPAPGLPVAKGAPLSVILRSAPAADDRLYPKRPILAVSVAVFREGRVLVGRRAREPMIGRFSLARRRRRGRRDPA